MKKPPEHVPSLETVTDGGRELTALERSLVGRWIWQDFYTSGSFSARVELHMFLLPDGHCVRTSRSIASSTFYDNAGNWAGFADAESSLPPEDRGSWSATSALLALEMDDGSAYEYRYHVEGSKMTTRDQSRDEILDAKSGLSRARASRYPSLFVNRLRFRTGEDFLKTRIIPQRIPFPTLPQI